jgi:hypothetical protein
MAAAAAAKDAAVTLSSGHRMPAVGLGVWRMDKPDVRGLIHAALRLGYRHLDCAGKRNPKSTGTRPPKPPRVAGPVRAGISVRIG